MTASLSLGIVIPTLNSIEFIENTILSILPLIDSGAKCIVVDSGSVDGTLDICERYGIVSMYHPPGNMYAAINSGIDALSTKWVTYINSDDLLYSDSVFRAIHECPDNADCIYGGTEYIDKNGRVLFSKRAPNSFLLRISLRNAVPIHSQPGAIFKKEMYEELHGFDEKFIYSSDFDFFLRAVLNGFEFARYGTKPLAAFRLHEAQFSTTKFSEMQNEGHLIRIKNDLEPNMFLAQAIKAVFRLQNIDTILYKYLRLLGRRLQ